MTFYVNFILTQNEYLIFFPGPQISRVDRDGLLDRPPRQRQAWQARHLLQGWRIRRDQVHHQRHDARTYHDI